MRARRRALRGLLAVRRGGVWRVPNVHRAVCSGGRQARMMLAGRRAGHCAVRCVWPYGLELGQRPGELRMLQQELLQCLRALRCGEQAGLGLRGLQFGREQRRVELQDVLQRALQHKRVALPQAFRALTPWATYGRSRLQEVRSSNARPREGLTCSEGGRTELPLRKRWASS